jgi:GAF domain-containing protein
VEGNRQWSEADIQLAQAISEQFAQAAENLRLLEQTQHSAARERLTSEIAGRVRESLDVDAILQTAVRELGRALGEAKVEVRLGTGPTSQD